ncbi:hypothetical protein AVEN_120584-1 [Araneus ventricosus]|uniref:Uncharacterized protein n=1 Tax=Araneus ventricosus TaxID=182803 RepID=A0A4Y2LFV7_ARAVE|nr:hypothetical protein AVEN_120584-1 [Araneus ventricosus]
MVCCDIGLMTELEMTHLKLHSFSLHIFSLLLFLQAQINASLMAGSSARKLGFFSVFEEPLVWNVVVFEDGDLSPPVEVVEALLEQDSSFIFLQDLLRLASDLVAQDEVWKSYVETGTDNTKFGSF